MAGGSIRAAFIAQGLVRSARALSGRPLTADELESEGYPLAARAKRLREWFA